MRVWKLLAFCFGICFLLLSCHVHKSLVSKGELIKYINDPKNGLLQQQEVNGIKVEVSFQPLSLMVSQELKFVKKIDSITIDSISKKYQNQSYFLLKYSKNNKELIRQLGSYARYSDMLQVLAFQMQSYINITTPKQDTVVLSDYVFEQNYGLGDANTILLVFVKDKLKDANKIEINVAECGFGIGDLKFSFKKSDIDGVPKLDFTKLD
jgi:hypothetical protein